MTFIATFLTSSSSSGPGHLSAHLLYSCIQLQLQWFQGLSMDFLHDNPLGNLYNSEFLVSALEAAGLKKGLGLCIVKTTM